jgi:hypothetical protein
MGSGGSHDGADIVEDAEAVGSNQKKHVRLEGCGQIDVEGGGHEGRKEAPRQLDEKEIECRPDGLNSGQNRRDLDGMTLEAGRPMR